MNQKGFERDITVKVMLSFLFVTWKVSKLVEGPCHILQYFQGYPLVSHMRQEVNNSLEAPESARLIKKT